MSKKLLAHALCAYIGTKSVLATTMTRGEYNEYRGWQIPENEDLNEQGYLIEYVDGGKPNDDRHAGYTLGRRVMYLKSHITSLRHHKIAFDLNSANCIQSLTH